MSGIKHTPLPWDWEERVSPFYNDVNGYSCGGEGLGIADIYQVSEDGQSLWDEDGNSLDVPIFDVGNLLEKRASEIPDGERQGLFADLVRGRQAAALASRRGA